MLSTIKNNGHVSTNNVFEFNKTILIFSIKEFFLICLLAEVAQYLFESICKVCLNLSTLLDFQNVHTYIT